MRRGDDFSDTGGGRYDLTMRIQFVALLTFTALCACGSSDSGASQGGLADPSVRAKLRALALQVSSANGVPSPKTITAVYSPDREAAEKVLDFGIGPNAPDLTQISSDVVNLAQ